MDTRGPSGKVNERRAEDYRVAPLVETPSTADQVHSLFACVRLQLLSRVGSRRRALRRGPPGGAMAQTRVTAAWHGPGRASPNRAVTVYNAVMLVRQCAPGTLNPTFVAHTLKEA